MYIRKTLHHILLTITGLNLLVITSCNEFADPSENYIYEIPSSQSQLQTNSLENVGLNSDLIVEMTDLIIREDFKRIDGLLILKDNQLVYEEYFHGYSQEVLHNIYSSTKSITSILTGIAINEGFIDSINTPILELLPEYSNIRNQGPLKDQITVEHLLNMSSGLNCEDWFGRTEERMNQTDDWVKFTLDLAMVDTPGKTGNYCTGNPVILGRIIENQSKLSIEEFANKYLFDPLGIKEYQWEVMPNGRISAGGKLFLRPRDMAKIGLLMLNKGSWDENQLLSPSWVAMSQESGIELRSPFSGYGLLWWKQTFEKDGEGVFAYFSSGNGGQDIFIIPSQKMVIVFTSGNANTGIGLQNLSMINEYILKAAK
ncbi:MAG: serine hydrolase [Bacteroidota bacterium]